MLSRLAMRLRTSAAPFSAAAAAATATAAVLYEQQRDPVHTLQGTRLVMSGDCGGTNTRFQVYRVPTDAKAIAGHMPPGELVLSKKCAPAPPPPPPVATVTITHAPRVCPAQVPQLVPRLL